MAKTKEDPTQARGEVLSGGSIAEKAVCLSLTLRRPGVRRKLRHEKVEVDGEAEARQDLLHVGKDILDSEELKAVAQFDSETRAFITKRCLPSLFKGGVYLLPVPLVDEVDETLRARIPERDALAEAFLAAYPRLVEKARTDLRSHFDEENYPDVDRVRALFGMGYRYFTFATPSTLKGVSKAIFAREAEKTARWWQDAREEAQQVLRAATAELVDHLVDRLSVGPDGKKKVFQNTLVTNLDEFIGTFDARNVADDGELKALVERMRGLVKGQDATSLRSDDGVREKVRAGFEEVKQALDAMVVDKPSRFVALTEDEPAAAGEGAAPAAPAGA